VSRKLSIFGPQRISFTALNEISVLRITGGGIPDAGNAH
jgi:hypothetical protein